MRQPSLSEQPEPVRFGFITADDLDDDKIAYAVQASGKKLLLAIEAQQIEAEIIAPQFVKCCRSRGLVIGFMQQEFNKLKRECVRAADSSKDIEIGIVPVSFILKYSYFSQLYKAVELIPHKIIERLLLCNQASFTTNDDKETLLKVTTRPPQQQYREYLYLDGFQLVAY